MYRLIILFVLTSISGFGQTVSVIDFVKIKENKSEEAIFFYNNNWKLYREEALKKKYIVSYKILKTSADPAADFDFMLITEYADRSQQALAEARFQEIIKTIRPDGPKLLNELKPNDFRQNVFVKIADSVSDSN